MRSLSVVVAVCLLAASRAGAVEGLSALGQLEAAAATARAEGSPEDLRGTAGRWPDGRTGSGAGAVLPGEGGALGAADQARPIPPIDVSKPRSSPQRAPRRCESGGGPGEPRGFLTGFEAGMWPAVQAWRWTVLNKEATALLIPFAVIALLVSLPVAALMGLFTAVLG